MSFYKFTGSAAEYFPSIGLTAKPGYVYNFGNASPPSEPLAKENQTAPIVASNWIVDPGPATDFSLASAQATDLATSYVRGVSSSAAFAGVVSTLRRGQRSVCVALVGDSTGDGKLVGAGTNVDEWPQVLLKKLAADNPVYTLMEKRWNDTNQGYDAPITWQAGLGNAASGAGLRGALFAAGTPGSMQYQGAAITTDLDVRVQVNPASWTPAAAQTIAAKWEATSNQRSWLILLNTAGTLGFNWSTGGTAGVGQQNSTVAVSTGTGFVNGQPFWVRVTLTVATGVINFYTSPDGATWTQLGTTVTTSATSLFGGTAPYQIGAFSSGLSSPYSGKVHWIDIRSGLTSQQSVVAPLPDDWDWYSNETTVSLVGAPVLMFLNGSQSGQNVVYFDNSTRRPIIHQPHGQAVVMISSAHNDGTQSRQLWLTNYAAMVTNINSLVPNVPILALGQNPVGLGGSFSITQQGIELRAARCALLQQWAASQAGVYCFDAWPFLTSADTVDQLHPTSGAGSGSEKWGLALYNRITVP